MSPLIFGKFFFKEEVADALDEERMATGERKYPGYLGISKWAIGLLRRLLYQLLCLFLR